jgi:hypothetical protein
VTGQRHTKQLLAIDSLPLGVNFQEAVDTFEPFRCAENGTVKNLSHIFSSDSGFG